MAEQLDLLITPSDRARPWRIAAEVAATNPYLAEWQREKNARYYIEQAERIERGE